MPPRAGRSHVLSGPGVLSSVQVCSQSWIRREAWLMQDWLKPTLAAGCVAIAILSGCGSSSSTTASRGGTVTVMDVAGGIDSLDPGYWYYQEDNTEMAQPAQRALYGWPPAARKPVPDLASGMPRLSDGGKTLTIPLKSGIHYSPPLQRR